ncbi:MAG: cell division protein ZapE [Propylenella sp.]
MVDSVSGRYEAMARSGAIVPDAIQRSLVAALDELNRAIGERALAPGKGGLGNLLRRRQKPPSLRGLYIWGGAGRGKTLLMDLFFGTAPTARKRRVHFHPFMAETHDRIAIYRDLLKRGEAKDGDPIPAVAGGIASEIELLCFDEFAVDDIADAMILGRLFERLFALGVKVVATTNVAPDDLYKDGLNRALFLPFIALIKKHMSVFHLDAPRDFRLDSEGTERRYVTPLGAEADACLDAHFRHLAGNVRGEPAEISSKGRRIRVPEALDGLARFGFDDLCSIPLGAGDYLKIAERFHTIVLAGVPILSRAHRNEAKRFINLIDTIYDMRVRLIVSAEAEPDALWRGDGVEAFEFRRTSSRLVEMRSDAYWNAAAANARHKKEARTF